MPQLGERLPQDDGTLEELDLAHNHLTGEITRDLFLMRTLRTINLASNKLEGMIPPMFGQLINVTQLDLSHNNFLGNIPKELGDLIHLRSLDLSHNQLVGGLPASILRLNELESLNISVNPLCGRIPNEKESSTVQIQAEYTFLGGRDGLSTDCRFSDGMESLLKLFRTIPDLCDVLDVSESTEAQLKELNSLLLQEKDESPREALWSLLPADSSWRLWIPLAYWLKGEPLPAWADTIPSTWGHMDSELVKKSLLLAQRFSQHNPLYIIASFGAHAFLQHIQVQLYWFKEQDADGKTPLQIAIQRTQQEEQRKRDAPSHMREIIQRRIDRFEFCMRELCNREAELKLALQRLIQQNGTLEQQRQDYDVEEHVLMSSLRSMIQTADSNTLVGHLLRVHQELKAFLEIGECSEGTKFWLRQCMDWLPRVIQLHWRGLQPLESHRKAYSRFKRSGLRKFSPFSKSEAKGLLRAVCRELRKGLPLVAHYLNLRCQQAYVEVQKWLLIQENAPSVQSGTWLHDLELGSVLMTPSAGENLLPRTPSMEQSDFEGSDTVNYQNVQFSCLTDNQSHTTESARLDIEFAVTQLSKLLVGHGKRASRVVQLNKDDRSVIMIATRHAPGVPLSQILHQYPELLRRCQRENYTEMALVSMALDIQDPRGSHYLAEMEYDSPAVNEVQARCLYLLDVHSTTPILAPCNSSQRGNILYLLPWMDQSVSEASRQRILEKAPEVILMEWFAALYRQNMRYHAMCEAGVYSSHSDLHLSTEGDGQGVQLSIRRLPEQAIPALYHRMSTMYQYLSTHSDATLHDLLVQLDPVAASRCQIMRNDRQTQWPESPSEEDEEGVGTESCQWVELKEAVKQLLDLMSAQGVEALWKSSSFERYQFLLPESTYLMHTLITSQRLTPPLLECLLQRSADVQQISHPEGEYPVNLVIQHYGEQTPALLEALVRAGCPLNQPNASGMMITDIIEDYMPTGSDKLQILELVATLLQSPNHESSASNSSDRQTVE